MAASTSRSGASTLIFLILFSLLWSGITLLLDRVLARNACRQIAALTYASTNGAVTASEVTIHGGRHGETTSPKITYEYQVAGKKHVGDRYRYGQMSSNDGNARRVAAEYPVGRQVTVYYAPDDPSDAVLVAGLEGTDLFVAMFMTPFNAVMLGIWLGLAVEVRNRLRPRTAGGVRFWDDGYQTRVRLPRFPPSTVGLTAPSVVAFTGIFLIGFTAGFNPPMLVMEIAWTVILGGACVGYLIARLKVASGTADLVIDDLNRSITLPRTFGRKEQQAINADQLQSVAVDDVVRSSRVSTSHSFAPTLIWRDGDGAEHREKLAQWTSSDSAEQFATWLRERLHLKP